MTSSLKGSTLYIDIEDLDIQLTYKLMSQEYLGYITWEAFDSILDKVVEENPNVRLWEEIVVKGTVSMLGTKLSVYNLLDYYDFDGSGFYIKMDLT